MKHVGFVIANDLEEYLSYSLSDRYSYTNIWCRTDSGRMFIQMIRVFVTFDDSKQYLSKIKTNQKTWILELLETDRQFIVSCLSNEKPLWL